MVCSPIDSSYSNFMAKNRAEKLAPITSIKNHGSFYESKKHGSNRCNAASPLVSITSVGSSQFPSTILSTMYETEFDNLAVGRFMDSFSYCREPDYAHSSKVKHAKAKSSDQPINTLKKSKKMLIDDCSHLIQALPEEIFTQVSYSSQLESDYVPKIQKDYGQNLTVQVDQDSIEPPCVKTDVNCYQLETTCQDNFAESVIKEHGGGGGGVVGCESEEQEPSLMDNLEETLQLFIKECMGEEPSKLGQVPQQRNKIDNHQSAHSHRSPPKHFPMPQQRAPKSASRYHNRDQNASESGGLLQVHQHSAMDPCATTCCSFNPQYTVTEWLQPNVANYRSSPRQSIRSSLTINSFRGKKRALSSSPLSTDGIDLNAVIRTSPTSLVAYINGSQAASASLSPALSISSDRTGCYGHLSARSSPFGSRSSSSLRRSGILSPISAKNKGDYDVEMSVLECDMNPFNDDIYATNNQSIQTLENNLQILDNSYASDQIKKEISNKCKCSKAKANDVLQDVKPPPSYFEHMAESMKRNQNKNLKSLKESVENEDKQTDFSCKWIDCKSAFDEQHQLVKHIEKCHVDHRKGDEFTCFWHGCPRRKRPFNARYKLLIHMRVHSGEKPNKCTFEGCTKAFSRLENLKIHERSHTGEKPYVCQHPDCMKRFSNSSDRAKHQRTHFDTKPYACQVLGCNKRYTDPSSLRKHVKNHLKEPQVKKKIKGNKSEVSNEEQVDGTAIYASQKKINSSGNPSLNSESNTKNYPLNRNSGRRLTVSYNGDLDHKDNSSARKSKASFLPPLTDKVQRYHIPVLQDYAAVRNEQGYCDSEYPHQRNVDSLAGHYQLNTSELPILDEFGPLQSQGMRTPFENFLNVSQQSNYNLKESRTYLL